MTEISIPPDPPLREPVPGAPLTAGEAAGPGLRLQAEQIASGPGNAQRVKDNFLESRSAPLENAATTAATREIGPTPQPGTSPVVANDQLTTALKNANESARISRA